MAAEAEQIENWQHPYDELIEAAPEDRSPKQLEAADQLGQLASLYGDVSIDRTISPSTDKRANVVYRAADVLRRHRHAIHAALRLKVGSKASGAESMTSEAAEDDVVIPFPGSTGTPGMTASGLRVRKRGAEADQFSLNAPEAANQERILKPVKSVAGVLGDEVAVTSAVTTESQNSTEVIQTTPAEFTETSVAVEGIPVEPMVGQRRRLDVEVDAPSEAPSVVVPGAHSGLHRGPLGVKKDFPLDQGGTHKVGVPTKNELQAAQLASEPTTVSVAPEIEGFKPPHL
jgi:hypothetical protein